MGGDCEKRLRFNASYLNCAKITTVSGTIKMLEFLYAERQSRDYWNSCYITNVVLRHVDQKPFRADRMSRLLDKNTLLY